MAWTASGLYVATMRDMVKNTIAGDWTLATSRIALHNNSDTPDYTIDPGTWTNANEVSGTGWAAGGVLLSAAAVGATIVVPTAHPVAVEDGDVGLHQRRVRRLHHADERVRREDLHGRPVAEGGDHGRLFRRVGVFDGGGDVRDHDQRARAGDDRLRRMT